MDSRFCSSSFSFSVGVPNQFLAASHDLETCTHFSNKKFSTSSSKRCVNNYREGILHYQHIIPPWKVLSLLANETQS